MYIADLHIHSRFSRATSKDGNPENLELWARRKGIDIVGTGDFTHPEWRKELAEKLEPAEDGFYTLKEEYRISSPSAPDHRRPRFVVTGEISSIYKQDGRVRKVHNVILLPGLSEADLLSKKLEAIGNIHSDGRPILGLSSRDLLEITMEVCPRAMFVPAHIWTPHFSMFGAFSGFDSIEECFGDMSPYVHAVETGLSSDPPMNWRLSALDGLQLISNSDAHSPAKLGREANLLDIPMEYDGLYGAVQRGDGLFGTIEFFPEEGKYHFDGHRKCHVCLSPVEAEQYGGICPVCKRKLTVGVSHRVEQLADRPEGYVKPDAKKFESFVPLPEVIAASTGRSSGSRKVEMEYEAMIGRLGAEFEILREVPFEDIRGAAGERIAEGIRRLREGEVERIPGYDGEYGTIRLFEPGELETPEGQMSFFTNEEMKAMEEAAAAWEVTAAAGEDAAVGTERTAMDADAAGRELPAEKTTAVVSGAAGVPEEKKAVPGAASVARGKAAAAAVSAAGPGRTENFAPASFLDELNGRQRAAVTSKARAIAVSAGPGTGKTKTLVSRILYLLKERGVKPEEITAVTFTKKAAGEMRERLEQELGGKRAVSRLRIGTFHAICYDLLKEAGHSFELIDDGEAEELAGLALSEAGLSKRTKDFLRRVSLRKTGDGRESGEEIPEACFDAYERLLKERELLDFDDLLVKALELSETETGHQLFKNSFSHLLVDEFQDISPLQFRLILSWNRDGRELFAIGDPDQAIYSFRGADAGCFDRLKEAWSQLESIRLTENYRSAGHVLSGASAVIERNGGGRRELSPKNGEGEKIRIVTAPGERSEDIFIAKEIGRMTGGMDMLEAQEGLLSKKERKLRGFSDIAVLTRTHRQMAMLEECLKTEGIPYVAVGRGDFLSEPRVRGTVCFFRYAADRKEEQAGKTAGKLLWGLSDDCIGGTVVSSMADQYEELYRHEKPAKLLEKWIKEMGFSGDDGMEKLRSMALFYKTAGEFFDALEFGEEGDLKRCGQKRYTAEAVTLMTLHGSKGLEFPVVFLAGVRHGVLPLESGKEPANVPEERRLFYVGMTRAKEELIVTASGEESPFLADIPQAVSCRETAGKNRDAGRQLSLFDFMKG